MSDSVFAPRYRAMSVGVLMSVSIVAFQALGVGTVMPAVARDLGGLAHYGWAFSAFMLASVVGSVAAGQDTDRAGPVRAYLGAVGSFAAGSVLAAVAGSWAMLLAGRVLEGLGAGALGVVTYASASRAYPPEMYGRMLALMSSAWVLPSLAGPAVAGLVADHTTWRWVFVLLLPFLPVAVLLTLPGLRALAAPAATARLRRLPQALMLAAGIGLFLSALELDRVAGVLVLGGAGALLALHAARALMPAGHAARRARPAVGDRRAGTARGRVPRLRRLHAARADGAARVQLLAGRPRDQRRVAELEPRRRSCRRGWTAATTGRAARAGCWPGSRSCWPASR